MSLSRWGCKRLQTPVRWHARVRHLLRLSRNALALAACAVISAFACTFPTVEYQDGGAATPATTPACNAPTSCAADAQKCGNDARKEYDACVHPCAGKPGTSCQATCDSALSVKLGQCGAVCESCAQSLGCANAAVSCKALAGG